jgi:hypothetical protein
MKRTLLLLTFLSAVLLAHCGDVGVLSVSLTFPDMATQAATRTLIVVTREEPKSGNGCDALWTMQSNGLHEERNSIPYPNRNDILASNVNLAATNMDGSRTYSRITLLVYAYDAQDSSSGRLIAAGCQDVTVADPGSTLDVVIKLQHPPGSASSSG